MAKRTILTRREKNALVTGVLALLGLFLMVTLIISSITVDPVVEGVDPTAWQSVHAWFSSVREFLFNNYVLFLMVAALIFLYALFKRRK